MVLADLRRTDTGNQALQHLGVLWIIYEYATEEEPITTVRLGELTGVNTASLIRFTERLAQLELITRRRVKGSNGKGKAWAYSPSIADDVLALGLFKIRGAISSPENQSLTDKELASAGTSSGETSTGIGTTLAEDQKQQSGKPDVRARRRKPK
jgi:hypothetical protein